MNDIVNQINNLAKSLDVSMHYAVVRCIECGKHIPHNQDLIQKHYLNFHNADSKNKIGTSFKFDKTLMPKVVKY